MDDRHTLIANETDCIEGALRVPATSGAAAQETRQERAWQGRAEFFVPPSNSVDLPRQGYPKRNP